MSKCADLGPLRALVRGCMDIKR